MALWFCAGSIEMYIGAILVACSGNPGAREAGGGHERRRGKRMSVWGKSTHVGYMVE